METEISYIELTDAASCGNCPSGTTCSDPEAEFLARDIRYCAQAVTAAAQSILPKTMTMTTVENIPPNILAMAA